MTTVARIGRSLVFLGALVGVFAVHSLSLDHDSTASVVMTAPQQAEQLAVSEDLERIAFWAPSLDAPPAPAHSHLAVSCLALIGGSLVLLVVSGWVTQRRVRGPAGPVVTAQLRSYWSERPPGSFLRTLCVLRT